MNTSFLPFQLFGLPGLMCTASQGCTETSEPLVLYGPVGLRKFLQTSLLLSQSMLGFDYIVHEMVPAEEQLTDTLVVRILPQFLICFFYSYLVIILLSLFRALSMNKLVLFNNYTCTI